MKIRKRHFKVEIEIADKAFEGEYLYTAKEIRKLIKNRLPYTLNIKKLKVVEIKNPIICPYCKGTILKLFFTPKGNINKARCIRCKEIFKIKEIK